MFSYQIARELHEKRDYHNERLKEFCDHSQLPLADICSKLRNEHFGDELHPNDEGAKMIAAEVHRTFLAIHETKYAVGIIGVSRAWLHRPDRNNRGLR